MLFWILAAAVVVYFFLSLYNQVRKLPPGPTPLPLIGNFHQLALDYFKHGSIVAVWRKWREEYGDVYTFWLGPLPTVNICNYQLAQDAMVKKGSNFVDRVKIYIFDIVRNGMGIIMSNGDHWVEQRRFALHTLRDFGLSKNVMQERIMLEYSYRSNLLDKEIEKAGGRLNMDPYHFLELTIGNVINRILFTERFVEEEEKEFFRLKQIVDNLVEQSSVVHFALTKRTSEWPILKQQKEQLVRPIYHILDFIKAQVEQRKAEIASGQRDLSNGAEDFVDAFLLEMEKSDKGDSFTERSLIVTLFDLWLAGQETTTTTLQWAISYLIQNPHDLKQLQTELDQTTGRNRPVHLSDKPNTPFLNAVILEVLRVSSLVPMNLWRVTAEDTQVGAFLIDKGTAITAQLSVIMADKEHFKNPQKFDPSRFLENNNDPQVVAFGLGKRACLGESLARAELYLILGNLVLDYDIVEDPSQPASMEAITEKGSVRKAKSYKVFFSKRD